MNRVQRPWLWFWITLMAIAVFAWFGPEEKTLGPNVRPVYLHGAWVLTAQMALGASALAGVIGLIRRHSGAHRWSAALGRVGMVFWVTYLPLSLVAMQLNWNGLFLAEPRFRLALTFAIAGTLLQVGLWLIQLPWLTSLANAIFFIGLRLAFSQATYVMHPPPSPIFNSGEIRIIGFFLGLNALTILAAFWLVMVFLSGREISSR